MSDADVVRFALWAFVVCAVLIMVITGGNDK